MTFFSDELCRHGQLLWLAQAKHTQHEHDHYDQSNQVNDLVHFGGPCLRSEHNNDGCGLVPMLSRSTHDAVRDDSYPANALSTKCGSRTRAGRPVVSTRPGSRLGASSGFRSTSPRGGSRRPHFKSMKRNGGLGGVGGFRSSSASRRPPFGVMTAYGSTSPMRNSSRHLRATSRPAHQLRISASTFPLPRGAREVVPQDRSG